MQLVPESHADALLKVRYQKSMISLHFRISPRTGTELECPRRRLTPNEIGVLRRAVKHNATYQWFIDGLPVSGPVGGYIIGDSGLAEPVLYTHRHIDIGYNGSRIVEAVLHTDRPIPLSLLYEKPLTLTYEGDWHPSPKLFSQRTELSDADKAYFENSAHWFGVSNVYLVAGVLLLIVINIHKQALRGPGEEHSLVFTDKDTTHHTEQAALLSACLGVGAQCTAGLIMFVVVSVLGGATRRTTAHELMCWGVFYFGVAGFCGGLVSGKTFAGYKNGNVGWLKLSLLTVSAPFIFLIGSLFCIDIAGSSLPETALLKPSSQFSTFSKLYLTMYWLIAVVPLTFAGTLLGRSLYAKKQQNKILMSDIHDQESSSHTYPSSAVHPKKWCHRQLIAFAACGVAGGCAALLEIRFVYDGIWGANPHYCYISYNTMLLSTFGTLLVAGLSSTLATYYTSSESIYWKWTTFKYGTLSGVPVLAYSWGYYLNSGMTGFFQAVTYMAFVAVVSGVVSFSEGFVSYIFSQCFIRSINGISKSE